jgi:hypothetical protein
MGLKLSGAQGVGHCGSGGAQAKWLWNSEAGLMFDADNDADSDDDDEDLFWPLMMTKMMMMVMLVSG